MARIHKRNGLIRGLGQNAANFFKSCRSVCQNRDRGWRNPKRDVVVCRVVKARDSLESAKSQFESALDHFASISPASEGKLKEHYSHLKQQLAISENRSARVSRRIREVEEASSALFDEWQEELEQYKSRQLRSNSRQQLKLARQHYKKLIRAMHQAESRIEPVLAAFQDQVLFLKHNLNAQAIASLHYELRSIGIDIATLIRAMEQSIREANVFVDSVNGQKSLSYS